MRTRRSQSSSDPVSSRPTDVSGHAKEAGGHRTVLLHESIELLDIRENDIVFDATLGGAGHARLICEKLARAGVFIGVDADPDAIKRAEETLKGSAAQKILINTNFRNILSEMKDRRYERIDKALFDLGWSGYQLEAGKGFSIFSDEPLVMTYANVDDKGLTAGRIVNEWGESSISDVIHGWGEERYARRIAKAIVVARTARPIEKASELAQIIKDAVPPSYRFGRIHPATKTFQALRIAVNDELGALSESLRSVWSLLASGGRIAVISFHSLEDRIVKLQFVAWEKKGEGKRLTKKPLTPSKEEVMANPRSRSAKLRVIQKS